jgi:hypothetical protein
MHYTTIDPPKSQRFYQNTMHYTTIDPQKVSDSTTRASTNTTPLTSKKSNHALHHHWRPSLNHWPPKRQRFEHTTMHYTTIDPQKSMIRTYKPTTMHYTTTNWPPKVKDSNPRPSNYTTITTIDLQNSKIQTQNHALHHHWPSKRQRFEPKTMHSSTCTTPLLTTKAVTFFIMIVHVHFNMFWTHTMQLIWS